MPKSLKFSLIGIAIVIAGIAAFKLSSSSLKNQINQKFPPISLADLQERSFRANNIALESIGSPDLIVNIGTRDFSQLVNKALDSLVKSETLKIPHIKSYTFSEFSLSTDDQQINLATDFRLELDTVNAIFEGKFEGVITFSVERDSLILLPALKNLHISHVDYEDKKISDKNIFLAFINNTLANFKDNINGFIGSKLRGFDINLLHKPINTENLPHNDTINIALSKPVEVSLPIVKGVCMINNDGIHILGAFTIADNTAQTGPPDSFRKGFREFQKKFAAKEAAAFPEAPSLETTFIALQKKLMAGVINQTLGSDTIFGNYDKDIIPIAINKEIVIRSADIDCGKIDFKCPEIPTPKLPSPPSLPDCNLHCRWWQQPACGIAEASCRAAEAGALAAYRVTCESLLSPWRTTNLAIKAQCASIKIPSLVTCEGIKKTIDISGGQLDLGAVKVEGNAHLKLNSSISGLRVKEDISTISFNLRTAAIVPAHINFELNSKPAGKVICPFNLHYPLDCIGSAEINNSLSSKVEFTKTGDNKILLSFQISPITIEAKLTPSPLEIIEGTFSSSFLSCPLISQTVGGVTVSLNLVKGFRDIFSGGDGSEIQNLIFDGKYKSSTPVYPVNIPIECKPFEMFGSKLTLKPLVQATYLGFSM